MIVLLFTGHLRILNDTAFGDCIKVFIIFFYITSRFELYFK